MRTYLASAYLESYLAELPLRVEIAPSRKSIRGEIGKKDLDVKTLSEPIHKKFVNWPSTAEAIMAFAKQFGILDRGCKYCYFALGRRATEFSFSLASWRYAQKIFQQYWDWNSNHGDWDVARDSLGNELMSALEARWSEGLHYGIEIADIIRTGPRPLITLFTHSLWQYMCALLMFYEVGDLRHCENPDCPAPRFVAGRKDQIFCTNDCAGLIAKRRWWAKHGDEWRKKRNLKARKGGRR